MIPFKRLLGACEYFICWYCHSQISNFDVRNWTCFPPSKLYWLPIQEMASLSVNTRKEMLNSTYPALYVVMFSILEGNTRYKNTNTQPNINNKEVCLFCNLTEKSSSQGVQLDWPAQEDDPYHKGESSFCSRIHRRPRKCEWTNIYHVHGVSNKMQEYPPLRREAILCWMSSNTICKKTWKAKLKILYRFERFPWKIKRGSHPLGQWR